MRLGSIYTAAAAAVVLAVAPAFGATFTGSGSAVFGTPTPTAGRVYTGVGTSTFTTGQAFSGSPLNTVAFTGSTFATTAGTPFAVASLRYTNGQSTTGTTVDSVPVTLTVNFTDPSGVSQPFTFGFLFNFTPNNTGNPTLDADIATPTGLPASSTFTVGSDVYTLALLGFSNDSGATILSQLTIPEDQSITSTLYASISESGTVGAAVTPLPAAVWAGAALLGTIAGRRNRRA